MCLFFPVWLLLAAAVWALPFPLWVKLGWDTLCVAALAAVLLRMRGRVTDLEGIPVESLAGRPCPSCGSTRTLLWSQGRVPLGIVCEACGRRSGRGDLGSR